MDTISYKEWAQEYEEEYERISNLIKRKKDERMALEGHINIHAFYNEPEIEELLRMRGQCKEIAGILKWKKGCFNGKNSITII